MLILTFADFSQASAILDTAEVILKEFVQKMKMLEKREIWVLSNPISAKNNYQILAYNFKGRKTQNALCHLLEEYWQHLKFYFLY